MKTSQIKNSAYRAFLEAFYLEVRAQDRVDSGRRKPRTQGEYADEALAVEGRMEQLGRRLAIELLGKERGA